MALRLMIYDVTCTGRVLGLSHAWWAGSHLYRAMGRLDASHAAASWRGALRWALDHDAPIAELQLWMHGRWGDARIDREVLDAASLAAPSPHAPLLAELRSRLTPESLVWFRTCETFGAHRGQRFARSLADLLGCRVAGHTHVIADWQSGLHSLAPGEVPRWSPSEGLLEGTPEAPRRARWSSPWRPRTLHCLAGRVPAGW